MCVFRASRGHCCNLPPSSNNSSLSSAKNFNFASMKTVVALSPPTNTGLIVNPAGIRYELGMEIELGKIGENKTFICEIILDNSLLKQQTRGRLLCLTRNQILVLVSSPFKAGVFSVLEAKEFESLSKLRFKKGSNGVLVLTFKSGTNIKLIVPNTNEVVELIKNAMKQQGHTNSSSGSASGDKERYALSANAHLSTARDLIESFNVHPSLSKVQDVMDLFREASEKFSLIDDEKLLEVISAIKLFLQRDDVISILDNSKIEKNTPPSIELAVKMEVQAKEIRSPAPHQDAGFNFAVAASSASTAVSAAAVATVAATSAFFTPFLDSFEKEKKAPSTLHQSLPHLSSSTLSPSAALDPTPPPPTPTPILSDNPYSLDTYKPIVEGDPSLELDEMLGDINSQFSELMSSFKDGSPSKNLLLADEEEEDRLLDEFSMGDLDALMKSHGIGKEE